MESQGLQVSAGIPLGILPLLQPGKAVGDHLVRSGRCREIQPRQPPRTRHPEYVLQRPRPEAHLEITPPTPSDVEAPGAILPRGIPQCRQRDGDFNRPTRLCGPHRRRPFPIPGRVHGPPVVSDAAVGLSAGMISAYTHQTAIAVIALTLFLSPFLIGTARRLLLDQEESSPS